MNERFERCLDLYLCPRVVKQRLNVDPKSLLPQLPKPRELQPFPTQELMAFVGHTNKARRRGRPAARSLPSRDTSLRGKV